MLVENWMNRNISLIDEEQSLLMAKNLFKKHGVQVLPVVSEGKLVGVITEGDIKRASGSEATTLEPHEILYLIDQIKVKEIMNPKVVTVPFDFTIEETAEVLLERDISGAPVVDSEGRVIGTISQKDLFRVLITLAGLMKKGVKFAFQVEDRPGTIMNLENVIRKYNGRITSILSSYGGVPKGYRNIFIRTYGIDRKRLAQLKEDLQKKATLLYVIDRRENTRDIYFRQKSESSI